MEELTYELNDLLHLGVAPYMFEPEASSSSESDNEENTMPQQERNRLQDLDKTW
jgi:hypothetical protein